MKSNQTRWAIFFVDYPSELAINKVFDSFEKANQENISRNEIAYNKSFVKSIKE